MTRVWSNTEAAAGHAPCIPHSSTEPYFNTSTAQLWYDLDSGATLDVPLVAWSEAPRPDWYVLAYSIAPQTSGFAAAIRGGKAETLGSRTFHAVNNGDGVTLSVTAPTPDPTARVPPFAVIAVASASVAPAIGHTWYVGVRVR